MTEIKQHEQPENLAEPVAENRLLSSIDRTSELLFGLIMALSFTCTISVINSDRTEVKDLLIGAIGCNIAWGLVDAVMFLLMTSTEKSRVLAIFNFVRKTKDIKKANRFIADALPPVFASMMKKEDIDALRNKLLQLPEPPTVNRITWKDFKMSVGVFLLVFISTFPVVIPFIFIEDLQTALRTSNLIAIIMMFFCGWTLGNYSGRNRLLTGMAMSLIGIALVLITISLGG